MGDLKEPLAFIVGAPRSGTTLLAAMFHRHPLVAVTPESHFFRILSERAMDPAEPFREWPGDALALLDALPWFEAFGLEAGAVVRRVDACGAPRTPVSLFGALGTLYAERRGKPMWMEKTPDHVRFLDAIRASFPRAKVLHIVRDGRDVALSLSKAGWPAYVGSTVANTNTWLRFLQRVERFLHSTDGTVRYKDLIERPEEELSRLCAVVGLAFHPSMLAPAGGEADLIEYLRAENHPDRRGGELPTFKDRIREPVDRSNKEKWRLLDTALVRAMTLSAHHALSRHGYDVSQVEPPAALVAAPDDLRYRPGGLLDRLASALSDVGIGVRLDEDADGWMLGRRWPEWAAAAFLPYQPDQVMGLVGGGVAGAVRARRLVGALARRARKLPVVLLYRGSPARAWPLRDRFERALARKVAAIIHDVPEPAPGEVARSLEIAADQVFSWEAFVEGGWRTVVGSVSGAHPHRAVGGGETAHDARGAVV